MNVKDPVPVQLPSLVTLQFTVCKPTPKCLPVRGTFPPPTESQQVTFWPSVLLAVTSSHRTDTIELPAGIHWSSTLGRESTGVAVQEEIIQLFSLKSYINVVFKTITANLTKIDVEVEGEMLPSHQLSMSIQIGFQDWH